MIRISRKADYAVFIMGCLAQAHAADGQPAGRRRGGEPGPARTAPSVWSAQEIAQKTHLSKALVANLLKDLTRAGLLESVRGLRGGYRLAQPPASISLAQILTAVEGPFTLVTCAGEAAGHHAAADHNCTYSSFCPSRSPMRTLHERIARMLAETKLPELCGTPLAGEPLAAGALAGARTEDPR
jgi:Rrf2 family protein